MSTPTKTKRTVARGVSLHPTLERSAIKRATSLDMSFSRYVQRLIEADLQNRTLVNPSLEAAR